MIVLRTEAKIPAWMMQLDQGPRIIGEEMAIWVDRSLNIIQGEIIPRTPVYQGYLAKLQSSTAGTPVSGVSGKIVTTVPYARPINDGTVPFMPPSDALVLWVKRVLGVSDKEAKGVAFVVARAISKRGIKGRHFFDDGWASAYPRVMSEGRAALARAVKRIKEQN